MRAIEDHSPLYNTKALVERGAKPDAQDDEGVTALMLASVKDERAMEYLIAQGARLDIRDQRGRTAADHAKERYPLSTHRQELLTPKPKVDAPRE